MIRIKRGVKRLFGILLCLIIGCSCLMFLTSSSLNGPPKNTSINSLNGKIKRYSINPPKVIEEVCLSHEPPSVSLKTWQSKHRDNHNSLPDASTSSSSGAKRLDPRVLVLVETQVSLSNERFT